MPGEKNRSAVRSKKSTNKNNRQNQYNANPRNFYLRHGDSTIMSVAKNANFSVLSSSTTVPSYYSAAFYLSDLAEVTSFTTLFDQYRFDYVQVNLLPLNQPPQAFTATLGAPPLLIAIDYDDAVTPPSLATLYNFENMQALACGQSRRFKFTPHSTVYEYNGAISIPSGNVTKQWHDCSQTAIPHFGVKYAFQTYADITAFQVWYTYGISFKNIR